MSGRVAECTRPKSWEEEGLRRFAWLMERRGSTPEHTRIKSGSERRSVIPYSTVRCIAWGLVWASESKIACVCNVACLPFYSWRGHAQRDWAPTCGPRDIKNIVLGSFNICCRVHALAPWRPRSAYPWCTGEASGGRVDEYSAPLSTGILFTSRPSRRAVCWMTLTSPASGWDRTHLMLRGHVARQRSGRLRGFSSGSAR
jgi:hypothetical protein